MFAAYLCAVEKDAGKCDRIQDVNRYMGVLKRAMLGGFVSCHQATVDALSLENMLMYACRYTATRLSPGVVRDRTYICCHVHGGVLQVCRSQVTSQA